MPAQPARTHGSARQIGSLDAIDTTLGHRPNAVHAPDSARGFSASGVAQFNGNVGKVAKDRIGPKLLVSKDEHLLEVRDTFR